MLSHIFRNKLSIFFDSQFELSETCYEVSQAQLTLSEPHFKFLLAQNGVWQFFF